jgi:hypothetical protein
MLAFLKLAADFARGCAHPAMRPPISATHPHPAIRGLPRMHLPGPSMNKGKKEGGPRLLKTPALYYLAVLGSARPHERVDVYPR